MSSVITRMHAMGMLLPLACYVPTYRPRPTRRSNPRLLAVGLQEIAHRPLMPRFAMACRESFRYQLGGDLRQAAPLGVEGLHPRYSGIRIVDAWWGWCRTRLSGCRTPCRTLSDSGQRRFDGCQSLFHGCHRALMSDSMSDRMSDKGRGVSASGWGVSAAGV